jgi:hypothetical protein
MKSLCVFYCRDAAPSSFYFRLLWRFLLGDRFSGLHHGFIVILQYIYKIFELVIVYRV